MRVIHSIESFAKQSRPTNLTIGMFDGMHLGHQALINRLVEKDGHCVVLTFSNHPAQVLYQKKISLLTSLSHRLALFEQKKVDTVILLPFTNEFSKQSATSFLTLLKQHLRFTHLILGHDSAIGQGREGDRPHLFSIANSLNFSLEYIEPIQVEKMVVSSSEIRKKIESGDLKTTSRLIGRDYSIFARVARGAGKGQILGFQTANLPVEGLCLPPLGVWAVKVMVDNQIYWAVANLGHAPTLHVHRPLCLEVHLLSCQKQFYGKEMEVIFLKHLRSERRFATLEMLKKQIKKDIFHAKQFFD
ncbi:MAG: bifunctional riboflavin kinase/FAD synthetase [Chlamydiales bacterium]